MTLEFLCIAGLTFGCFFLMLRVEKLEEWRRDVESTGLESTPPKLPDVPK